jgi:hypothetical protein
VYVTVEGDRVQWPLALALPNVCVKCGRTEGLAAREQRFRWVPPWTAFFLLVGLLPGAILQTLLTKRARLSLPICPSCNSRWSSAVLASRLALWGPLAITAVGCVLGVATNWGGIVAGAALLLLLPALLIGPALVYFVMMRPRSLRTTRIDSRAITLACLSPTVLEAARSRGDAIT